MAITNTFKRKPNRIVAQLTVGTMGLYREVRIPFMWIRFGQNSNHSWSWKGSGSVLQNKNTIIFSLLNHKTLKATRTENINIRNIWLWSPIRCISVMWDKNLYTIEKLRSCPMNKMAFDPWIRIRIWSWLIQISYFPQTQLRYSTNSYTFQQRRFFCC